MVSRICPSIREAASLLWALWLSKSDQFKVIGALQKECVLNLPSFPPLSSESVLRTLSVTIWFRVPRFLPAVQALSHLLLYRFPRLQRLTKIFSKSFAVPFSRLASMENQLASLSKMYYTLIKGNINTKFTNPKSKASILLLHFFSLVSPSLHLSLTSSLKHTSYCLFDTNLTFGKEQKPWNMWSYLFLRLTS